MGGAVRLSEADIRPFADSGLGLVRGWIPCGGEWCYNEPSARKDPMKHLLIAIVLVGSAAMTGCEKPLFPEPTARTQYERFDRLHGRYVPAETTNAYGGSEPALRDRLSPYRP